MAIIIPKLTDNRTLGQIHAQLIDDITRHIHMVGFKPEEDDTEEDTKCRAELEEMCLQLGDLEEVMSLKWAVDCDCFYR